VGDLIELAAVGRASQTLAQWWLAYLAGVFVATGNCPLMAMCCPATASTLSDKGGDQNARPKVAGLTAPPIGGVRRPVARLRPRVGVRGRRFAELDVPIAAARPKAGSGT
jgi:hypothetical protein